MAALPEKEVKRQSETVPYEAVGTAAKIPIGLIRVSALTAHELTRYLLSRKRREASRTQ